jgi:hypothetical protein
MHSFLKIWEESKPIFLLKFQLFLLFLCAKFRQNAPQKINLRKEYSFFFGEKNKEEAKFFNQVVFFN